jgi:putative transposase
MPLDNQHGRHPHFFFDTVDRVTIDGIHYIPTSRNSEGYLFRRADSTGVAEGFSNERIALLVREQRLSVEVSYYLPQAAMKKLSGPECAVSCLSASHETRVRMRDSIVQAFREMEKAKRIVRTDKSIEANRAALCDLAADFYARQAVLESDRTGERPKKFSARSLRRWLTNFERFGIGGNSDNYAQSGNRTGNMLSEARAILAQQVRGYLSRDRPTIATIARNTRAAFSAENALRAEKGLPPLTVPSRNAINEAIKRLDPFTVAVARYGEEEALRQMRQTGQGIFALARPMQRVEVDEHKIDLISIFKEEGLLEFFSADERKRLGLDGKKGRWWCTVAMCATTRCIVGMRLSRTPSRCSALETLQMMMVDKGEWADAVHAVSPWNMYGTPELVVTDCGSAFKSFEFRAACADLGIRVERSIAGLPHLRGRIERLFRTLGINLLPLLTGRTFSSILERGEYDSEARAALTADELASALIRWVVDIYHNTPHDGLEGATPLEVWNEAAATYGVRPPPAINQMAPIFARTMKRTLSGEGISVMGVRYHSEDLARFGLHHSQRELEVRWYPGDIGAIWVKMGDWVKVGAVFEGFDGVRAHDWIAAARRLRNTLRKGQEASQEIVFKAIREIVAMNSAAKARANILTDDWSDDSLAHIEGNLFQGFVVASKPAAPDTRLATDGMGHVVTPAAPEPTVAEPIATPIATPRRKGTGKMRLED